MKKIPFICGILFLSFFIVPEFGIACEPTPVGAELNLEQTIQAANLIIIGNKVREGPFLDPAGPSWTKIKVSQILKGSVETDTIKTMSFLGMCQYGITLEDNTPSVVFLSGGWSNEEVPYSSVGSRYGKKSYPIHDNSITIDGKDMILQDFANQYGLTFDGNEMKKLSMKLKYKPFILSGIAVIVLTLVALVIKKYFSKIRHKKS